MNKTIKYIGICAAILGVITVASIAAFASTGGFRSRQPSEGDLAGTVNIGDPSVGYAANGPVGPAGEVVIIDADHLILTTLNNRTLRVNINAQTIIRLVENGRAVSLSDIMVGDKVRVSGHINDDGSFEAQTILILPEDTDMRAFLPPPQGNPGLPGDQFRLGIPPAPWEQIKLVGQVVAPGMGGFTLQTGNDRELKVRILKHSVVRLVEGNQIGAADDIKSGDQVRVQGLPKGPGIIEAQLILVLPYGDHLAGRVSAVKDETITLATPQGEFIIVISEASQFQHAQGFEGSHDLQNIEEGVHVIAYGELQTDGSLIARLVILRRTQNPGGMIPGPHPPGLYPGPTP